MGLSMGQLLSDHTTERDANQVHAFRLRPLNMIEDIDDIKSHGRGGVATVRLVAITLASIIHHQDREFIPSVVTKVLGLLLPSPPGTSHTHHELAEV